MNFPSSVLLLEVWLGFWFIKIPDLEWEGIKVRGDIIL